MAKAKVLDDKLVITSEILTNENIEKVSILKPSVLILKDEEGCCCCSILFFLYKEFWKSVLGV